ncbi:MAG TPA: EAL domain-containing protein [Solirubrobacterales bacterium]|nr:EAL domain-containing protein [Solirubrobacterales bacterium]
MSIPERITSRPVRLSAPYAALVIFLAIYAAWHLLPSLPLAHSSAAAIFQSPLGVVAALVAWSASRRAGRQPRLRRAWLLIASALGAQAAGALYELGAELVSAELGYPSPADVLYLAFYPLMLAGVLCFPSLRRSTRQTLELTLDCAVVGLAGGAVFAYLVLGPTVLESTSTLEAVVTVAYPVADTILIVALAAALLARPLPAVRDQLRWLTGAIMLLVLGDLFWGYEVLQGTYGAESVLNIAYELSTACFILAAARQRAAGPEARARAGEGSRNGWLPFLAAVIVVAIFIRVDIGEPFFPNVLVSCIVALIVILTLTRQAVSLRDLSLSRRRLAEAQEVAQLGSWEWDVMEDRAEFSDEAARLLGLDPGSTLSFAEIESRAEPDDRDAMHRGVERAMGDGRAFAVELGLRTCEAGVREFLVRAEPAAKNGAVVRFRGTIQDITDRKRMEAQLEYQADHDPLTGLFNRRRFGEELERALRLVARYRQAGAVLMIDIDNFKTINDTHGHAVGDRALKGVAAAIAGRARETDVFARLGGDEFAVVLSDVTPDEAREVAEDIRARARRVDATPKLSVGIAPFDARARLVADDVLVAADMALYEAKDRGRDRVVVYSGKANGAMSWVERIRAALREDRFQLYAQPMIDLGTGKVSHRELLIRMIDEDGDIVPPAAFLPTAERVGLITDIDRWVTANGLRLARQGERVSINLAAPSIGDAQILCLIHDAIDDGVDPRHLIFEITETAAMSNMGTARAFVEELSELGCGVALDDFGTGFGSFTWLKHLPTSYLKIDMEFVSHMRDNATDREVVRSITDVAHSLGKQTVAEGVEDEKTLAALREYGVDCAQGFFIGPPEPIVTIADAPRTADDLIHR